MNKMKNKFGNLLMVVFSTLSSILKTKVKKIGIMQMSVVSIFILLVMPAAVFAAPLTGKASVIITFDDGWTSNVGDSTTGPFGGADMVQPILKANNQSAVAFIIEEPVVGGWGAYMNISQIQSLYADGWDISSHSLTHGSNYCKTPTSSDCVLYLVNANDSLFQGFPRNNLGYNPI